MSIVKALKDYSAKGIGVINGILPHDEIVELREAIEKIQLSATELPEGLKSELIFERDLPADKRADVPANAVGDSIFIIGDPPKFDRVFEKLINKKILYDIASQILKTDSLVFHFMNVTIKQAHYGRALALHRDYPNDYICPASSQFFRLMLCLDGMTAENGATQYAPDSHLLSDQMATNEKAAGSYSFEKLKTIGCPEGSCVLIHPKILHGGGMNNSASIRRNIVIQIGDASAILTTQNRESITGRSLNKSDL